MSICQIDRLEQFRLLWRVIGDSNHVEVRHPIEPIHSLAYSQLSLSPARESDLA